MFLVRSLVFGLRGHVWLNQTFNNSIIKCTRLNHMVNELCMQWYECVWQKRSIIFAERRLLRMDSSTCNPWSGLWSWWPYILSQFHLAIDWFYSSGSKQLHLQHTLCWLLMIWLVFPGDIPQVLRSIRTWTMGYELGYARNSRFICIPHMARISSPFALWHYWHWRKQRVGNNPSYLVEVLKNKISLTHLLFIVLPNPGVIYLENTG